ncbi:hypothetical protein [Phenylobacterium sp.]|jgi:hypothetical protein|uniref:hypothetical protein n=1 Tax=Phenylobacterium sp. TaxID=1871053 RepID=UPI002E38204C|nr:hypothetical protein [Phenylobacterium sp.]HEX2559591.1 hypothetical protein [Phenylobacterium sp.]
MLKQRRQYADKVAANLFEAEAAIDAALAKTAGLVGAMPLRTEAGLSALIGQGAFEWTSKSIQALTEARRAICEAHKELSIAQQQIGLGAVAYGDGGPKPPSGAQETAHNLRAVSKVA